MMSKMRGSWLSALMAAVLAGCTAGVGIPVTEQSGELFNSDNYEDVADQLDDGSFAPNELTQAQFDVTAASLLAMARTIALIRETGITLPDDAHVEVEGCSEGTSDSFEFCTAFNDLFPSVLEETLADFAACIAEGATNLVACAVAKHDLVTPSGQGSQPNEQGFLAGFLIVLAIVIVVALVIDNTKKADEALLNSVQTQVMLEEELEEMRCVDQGQNQTIGILLELNSDVMDELNDMQVENERLRECLENQR